MRWEQTPQYLKTVPTAELRKRYSKIRSKLVKRLQRLGKSEFAEDAAYQTYKNVFGKLSEVSEADLPYKLALAYRFEAMKTSTVKGAREQRSKQISRLREGGIDFVDESNIRIFGEFMERYRERGIARFYDSERALEYFGENYSKDIDTESLYREFENYVEHTSDF